MGQQHAHFINVGVVDAVGEADGRGLVGVAVRKFHMHPPVTSFIRAWIVREPQNWMPSLILKARDSRPADYSALEKDSMDGCNRSKSVTGNDESK